MEDNWCLGARRFCGGERSQESVNEDELEDRVNDTFLLSIVAWKPDKSDMAATDGSKSPNPTTNTTFEPLVTKRKFMITDILSGVRNNDDDDDDHSAFRPAGSAGNPSPLTLPQHAAAMAAMGVDLRLYSNLFPAGFQQQQQERLLQLRAASVLNQSRDDPDDDIQESDAEDDRKGNDTYCMINTSREFATFSSQWPTYST